MPLVRSTPGLGWVKVIRTAQSTVDFDMPQEQVKEFLRREWEKFIWWMEKEDGAQYAGGLVLHGPRPHFSPEPLIEQKGDRGGKRLIAPRLMPGGLGQGKLDYIIECQFWVKERLQELPADLAAQLFAERRPGIRPVRET